MRLDTDVRWHQLQEKQLDYVLVYSEKDYDEALRIKDQLTKCGMDGRLYDEYKPFENWTLEDEIEKMADLVDRSTFKFFLASNNLVDENDESAFVTHKSEALMNSINYRDQSVVPIWLVPKRDIDRSCSRVLYGLMALQGLNPNSKYFETNVKKLNEIKMFVDRKEERRKKQEEKFKELEEKEKEKARVKAEKEAAKEQEKQERARKRAEKEAAKQQNPEHVKEKLPTHGSSRTCQIVSYDTSDSFWSGFDDGTVEGLLAPQGAGQHTAMEYMDDGNLVKSVQPSDSSYPPTSFSNHAEGASSSAMETSTSASEIPTSVEGMTV